MCWNRIGLWASLCLLFFALTACESPGNVGEDLVGGLDGAPVDTVLVASTFQPDTMRDVTGNARRVLAGSVADPLLGTTSATGYVDFGAASSVPDAFKNGTVTSAELRLVPDYTYGSTTNPVTLRLYALRKEINTQGARSDTTFGADVVGELVGEKIVNPNDTLVVIPLLASFVTANDTTFKSSRFATSFHGFQIVGADETAIRGFDAEEGQLRVVSGGQTVNFPISKQLTTVDRIGEPALPEGRLLVQDGFGRAATLNFSPDQAGLPPVAINRVAFALYADTLTLRSAPSGFIRPLLREVKLLGVTDTGTEVDLGDHRLVNGKFVLIAPGGALIDIFQRKLQNQATIREFRIIPSQDANTTDPILFYSSDVPGTTEKDEAPQAAITYTPTE